MNWYYRQNGERKGPVAPDVIKTLLKEGTLSLDTEVQNDGMGDTWATIGVVPALAGKRVPPAAVPEPKEAEPAAAPVPFWKQPKGRLVIACAAIVLVMLVVLVSSRGKRARGVAAGDSDDAGLGTLAKMEATLIDKYQMEKDVLLDVPGLRKSAVRMARYNRPQCRVEEHITKSGAITLLSGERGGLDVIFASFPTPGPRGDLVEDPSLVSNLMNDLWKDHSGGQGRTFKSLNDALTSEIQETCGIADLPSDGRYALIEKSNLRFIWIEFGQDGESTIAYMETK